jgi:hypothetical protein
VESNDSPSCLEAMRYEKKSMDEQSRLELG